MAAGAGDRVMLSRRGLQLPRELPFERWLGIGRQLSAVSTSAAWCLGDWLAFGERAYAGRYRAAVEQTSLDYQTLRNYAWVARRFELSRRRDTLSFGHHAEVAALAEPEQDFWLRKAEEHQWPVKRLRQQVSASLAERLSGQPARAGQQQGGGERGRVVLRLQLRISAALLETCQAAADKASLSMEAWTVLAIEHAARHEPPGRARGSHPASEPPVHVPPHRDAGQAVTALADLSGLPRGARGRHTGPVRSFDELITEGSRVPVDGWDFSWFEGRASEERPPWRYSKLLGERMAALAAQPGTAALDLQTGGGEVLASIPVAPPVLVATECWPPNVEVARRTLAPLGAQVVPMDDELDELPFEDASFDLVVSRHPVGVRWDEIARVLKPGGTYFSQSVGERSVGELIDFLMGPQPPDDGPTRAPKWSVLAARAAGLEVVDLREFRGRMEFRDIAAVIHFLRKVVWTVPDFTVDAYADRLLVLHEQIEKTGPFVATSVRFLIEARKPI